MTKFQLAEPPFYTIQGEGLYTGVPSVFLRMFGCNFRCKGFNRQLTSVPINEKCNPEVAKIINNIDQYKSIDELPLVSTGCDSYLAIYPEFKKFVTKFTLAELTDSIANLLPYKAWKNEHLVITGGEPLLKGWQRVYPELFLHDQIKSVKSITFETNGTQQLSSELKKCLSHINELVFSVSPKLSCSGELKRDAICVDTVCDYQSVGITYLKFVVASSQDVIEALTIIEEYRSSGFNGEVYLMAVGGVPSVHQLNSKVVAELAMKYGLRYSDRLQVSLWGNGWST